MSLIRSSLLVGFGSVASRVLGFVRDVLFAQALGAGPVADAFLAAFRLPNLVRRVVGEGGLNPALVPALSRLEPDEAAATAGDVLTVFGIALLALTGLVEIGAGLLAFLLAPGLRDDGDAGAGGALHAPLLSHRPVRDPRLHRRGASQHARALRGHRPRAARGQWRADPDPRRDRNRLQPAARAKSRRGLPPPRASRA